MMKKMLAISTAVAVVCGSAQASSHREAPGLSNDPAADDTDLYSFKAAGSRAQTHQAFVIDISPGYIAQAGPNWYRFDDNVLYELHIDNNGDAVEDVTYQFRFTTHNDKADATNTNVLAFLPPITFDAAKNLYTSPLAQSYTVTKVTGGRRSETRSAIKAGTLADFPVAPPRIGPTTTDGGTANKDKPAESYQAYKTLANNAIIGGDGGYKFFAGPRNDPFFADLGAIFDAANIRILNTSNTDKPRDSLKGVNVLSIVLEIPVSELIPDSTKPFFGVWTTTSRPQAKILLTAGKDDKVGGGWVQTSRLGNPLVNEVVIGIKDKDKFNATQPKDDVTNFASYVVKPQLAAILNLLYGSDGATAKGLITDIGTESRSDLVDVFVAGVTGVSKYPDATGTGDMLRVNRSLDLGGGYVEGWPLNGRKLTDRVVKTALTFLAECKVLPTFGNFDISGIWANHKNTIDKANCALSDVGDDIADDATAGGTGQLTDFPYVDLPHGAYQ